MVQIQAQGRARSHRQRGLACCVQLLQVQHSKNPEINLLTHIDGAAKERAFLECLLDDLEEVGGWLLQLIPLCNATSEVLEAFSGGATREGLIGAIQPAQNWGQTQPSGSLSSSHTHTTIRLPALPFLQERHSMCQLSQHCCFQEHYSSYKRAPPSALLLRPLCLKNSAQNIEQSCIHLAGSVISMTGIMNTILKKKEYIKKQSRPNNLPL